MFYQIHNKTYSCDLWSTVSFRSDGSVLALSNVTIATGMGGGGDIESGPLGHVCTTQYAVGNTI